MKRWQWVVLAVVAGGVAVCGYVGLRDPVPERPARARTLPVSGPVVVGGRLEFTLDGPRITAAHGPTYAAEWANQEVEDRARGLQGKWVVADFLFAGDRYYCLDIRKGQEPAP